MKKIMSIFLILLSLSLFSKIVYEPNTIVMEKNYLDNQDEVTNYDDIPFFLMVVYFINTISYQIPYDRLSFYFFSYKDRPYRPPIFS